MNWAAAKQHCVDLTLDGGGWHLPTIGELRTLIRGCPATEPDGSCNAEAGHCLASWCREDSCAGCFELDGPADGCYWPDEMMDQCGRLWSWSAQAAGDAAWTVNFIYAEVHFADVEYEEPVRCVRQ